MASAEPQAMLAASLAEARLLADARAWTTPSDATLREAGRLLTLLAMEGATWPAPAVWVQPDGAVVMEWEAGERGWLALSVHGLGTLTHAAVIDGDDYGLSEDFADALPDWALELLRRLQAPRAGHA